MAEGTRLKDLSEHINSIEERLQQLTSDCNNIFEERLQQLTLECNKQIGILAQQLEEIQHEGQQRSE